MVPTLLQFCPLEKKHAVAVRSWRYPPPYEIYNLPVTESATGADPLLQTELHYVAVLDQNDSLVAFRCFGADAQVHGGDYRDDALDLGGGLRPDLTGQGLGRHVLAAAMNYAVRRFSPPLFRATVASFNLRAKKTCIPRGYHVVSGFTRASDGLDFEIMTCEARLTALSVPMRFVVRDDT